MKKIYFVIFIAFSASMLSACTEKFISEIELAVNDTRINISWRQAQNQLDFVYPIYSTGTWTIDIVAGGDWLSIDRNSGSGTQYVNCTATANTTDRPRVVKLEIKGAGKTIYTYVVTSSQDISAADLDNADLHNYLY
jgi:hypothetical protein